MREVEVAEIKTKIEEGVEASLKNSRQPLLEILFTKCLRTPS